MPLWAAVALPAAAYLLRSVARGLNFSPDLPADAIVFGILGVLVLASAIARGSARAPQVNDDLPTEVEHEHSATGNKR